jgi:hypothetical protein
VIKVSLVLLLHILTKFISRTFVSFFYVCIVNVVFCYMIFFDCSLYIKKILLMVSLVVRVPS